jgi:hypothetical protein
MAQELADKDDQLDSLSKHLADLKLDIAELERRNLKTRDDLAHQESENKGLHESNNDLYKKCLEFEELLALSEKKLREHADRERASHDECLSLRQVLMESSD